MLCINQNNIDSMKYELLLRHKINFCTISLDMLEQFVPQNPDIEQQSGHISFLYKNFVYQISITAKLEKKFLSTTILIIILVSFIQSSTGFKIDFACQISQILRDF